MASGRFLDATFVPSFAAMMHSYIAFAAVFFYLASATVVAVRLFRRDPAALLSRNLALALGFAGLLLHAWLLFEAIFRGPGLNLAFFNALSLTSWTVVTLLLASSITKPVENLGIVLMPIAALTVLLEAHYPSVSFIRQAASWSLKIHVLFSMLAYSLLTLASVQAILLAVQDHQLRTRHPGGFVRALPPLQTMESLLFEMIGAGFLLLTVALLSGFAFLEDMFAQHLVHKTVLSSLAWLVFGGLLVGRMRYGWRGRTAITWTLSGFVILILAYFGSKAVLELVLHR